MCRRRVVVVAAVLAAVALGAREVSPGALPPEQRGWASRQTGIVFFVRTPAKAVALTFDDGPDPVDTPAILAALRQAHAAATFFVLGSRAQGHPELVRAILASGSEVGNHTYGHDSVLRRGAAALRADVERSAAAIARVAGVRPRLFRFPGLRQPAWAVGVVRSMGYQVVAASVDPEDWRRPGVDAIVRGATEGVQPGDIILLHDGGDHPQTVAAVPRIVRTLQRRGFQLVTVSRLLQLGRPSWERG